MSVRAPSQSWHTSALLLPSQGLELMLELSVLISLEFLMEMGLIFWQNIVESGWLLASNCYTILTYLSIRRAPNGWWGEAFVEQWVLAYAWSDLPILYWHSRLVCFMPSASHGAAPSAVHWSIFEILGLGKGCLLQICSKKAVCFKYQLGIYREAWFFFSSLNFCVLSLNVQQILQ